MRSFLHLVIYFSSPLQDDFIVLHIPGEYDSVLETVFKTEFLTLLSSKYQDSLSRQLKVDITSRYDGKFKGIYTTCPVMFLYPVNLRDELLNLIFLETSLSCILFFKFSGICLITTDGIFSCSSLSLMHGTQDL